MKSWIIVALVALGCVSGVHAQEGSWYLGGNVSVWSDTDVNLAGFGTVDVDTGTGFGITVGYEKGPWRYAFEYGSLSPTIAGLADSDIDTLMFSVTWATPTGMKDVDLYVGSGLGFQDVESGSVSDDGITALFRVGVEYTMQERHKFGIGYKHQFFDDITLGAANYDATDAGAFELSYRILF